MQDQVKVLEQTVMTLKARLFDVQESAQSREQFYGDVFKQLSVVLEIPEDKAGVVESYFEAIEALKAPVEDKAGVVEA